MTPAKFLRLELSAYELQAEECANVSVADTTRRQRQQHHSREIAAKENINANRAGDVLRVARRAIRRRRIHQNVGWQKAERSIGGHGRFRLALLNFELTRLSLRREPVCAT
jgi:hypothetical protein